MYGYGTRRDSVIEWMYVVLVCISRKFIDTNVYTNYMTYNLLCQTYFFYPIKLNHQVSNCHTFFIFFYQINCLLSPLICTSLSFGGDGGFTVTCLPSTGFLRVFITSYQGYYIIHDILLYCLYIILHCFFINFFLCWYGFV